jgi:hypothetical protein
MTYNAPGVRCICHQGECESYEKNVDLGPENELIGHSDLASLHYGCSCPAANDLTFMECKCRFAVPVKTPRGCRP